MKPAILTAIEGNPVKLTTSEAPMGSPGAPLDSERIPPDKGAGATRWTFPVASTRFAGIADRRKLSPGSYGGRRCPYHRWVLRRPNSGELFGATAPAPRTWLVAALARRDPCPDAGLDHLDTPTLGRGTRVLPPAGSACACRHRAAWPQRASGPDRRPQKLEHRAAEMLEPVVAELDAAVAEAPSAHIDETSWTEATEKTWLWVGLTDEGTVFMIADNRGADMGRSILGTDREKIVSSDRYASYDWIAERQFRWSHLHRDFQAMIERQDEGSVIGERNCLGPRNRLFHWWHKVEMGPYVPGLV